jgi:Tfp pilus assembly protein PilO
MDVDNQTWVLLYDKLKNDFKEKRKFAANLNNVDQKDMNDRLHTLEKQLNVMKDSPMEYEM